MPQPQGSKITTDHDLIKKWVETRGGIPSTVKADEEEPTKILRIDFPGADDTDELKHISWDAFFNTFDNEELALMYQEETVEGDMSRFYRFMCR